MKQANGDRGWLTRRPVLMTIMALGAVITLTGANGIFAVFTDRATTGTNSATSRAEARSADLQIADGTYDGNDGSTTCGTYVENLTTGIITASDMGPDTPDIHGFVCLKNVGSRPLEITISAIDLVDTDTGCTGDESALDLTCGDDQAGELSGALHAFVFEGDCTTSVSIGNAVLSDMVATPFPLTGVLLASGEVECVHIAVADQAQQDLVTTSQSDTTTWKFAFDGTAT